VPGITVSGLFTGKTGDTLTQYSGLIAVDIDKIGENMEKIKRKLMALPYVAYVGLSISGKGLFCIIPLTENVDNFLYHFLAIKEEFQGYGIEIDESCKDITRFRFYSIDDNAYFNHEATDLHKCKDSRKENKYTNLVGTDANFSRVSVTNRKSRE